MTPEEIAAAEKEFTSGFDGKPAELTDEEKKVSETPAEIVDPRVEEKLEETVAKPAEVVADAPVVVDVPKAQLSDDQIRDLINSAKTVGEVQALVKKIQSDTAGRVGSIEHTLKEMRAASASGQPIDVSEDDFAELKKSVPDLVPQIVDGLKKALGRVKVGVPATPAPIETPEQFEQRIAPIVETRAKAIVSAEVKQEREQYEKDLAKKEVAKVYPKWNETVQSSEFQTWLQEQPHVYVETYNSSWDPAVVTEGLQKYHAFEKAKTAPKPDLKKVVADSRSQRLKEAIPAKGGASAPLGNATKTAEEEFAEGYAS